MVLAFSPYFLGFGFLVFGSPAYHRWCFNGKTRYTNTSYWHFRRLFSVPQLNVIAVFTLVQTNQCLRWNAPSLETAAPDTPSVLITLWSGHSPGVCCTYNLADWLTAAKTGEQQMCWNFSRIFFFFMIWKTCLLGQSMILRLPGWQSSVFHMWWTADQPSVYTSFCHWQLREASAPSDPTKNKH